MFPRLSAIAIAQLLILFSSGRNRTGNCALSLIDQQRPRIKLFHPEKKWRFGAGGYFPAVAATIDLLTHADCHH